MAARGGVSGRARRDHHARSARHTVDHWGGSGGCRGRGGLQGTRLELVDAREHAALTTANTGGRSRVWQDVLRGVEERRCGGLGCVVDETVDSVEGTDSRAVKACEGRNHLRKPVKTIKVQMKPYKIRMSIPEQFLTIIDKYFSFET